MHYRFAAIPYLLVLLSLPMAGDAAVPVGSDGFSAPVAGVETTIFLPRPWLDGRDEVILVDPPEHGAYRVLSYSGTVKYTPDEGFTGDDHFTYRLENSDGERSPLYTHRLRVHAAGDRAGLLVEIIVDDQTYAALQDKIDRLAAQLRTEGYTAEIVEWTSGDARAVWEHLKADYAAADKPLVGAILIGDIPTPDNADACYWNFGEFDHYSQQAVNIWVSRFYAKNDRYADRITSLGWALDNNYNYRTGRSRLPCTAAMTRSNDDYTLLDVYNRIWDATPGVGGRRVYDSMRLGDAFTYRQAHNSPVSTSWLFENCNQLRFAFISGCKAGKRGAAVSRYMNTYGGGGIMSIASQENTYGYYQIGYMLEYDDDKLLHQLNAGEPLGSVIVQSGDYMLPDGTFVYGDLSVGVKMTPHNEVPVIDAMDASTLNPDQGTTVTFTATGSDPDRERNDSSHAEYDYRSEWWFTGTGFHRKAPDAVHESEGASWTDSVTHLYDRPHVYTARVEMSDEWMARAWRTLTIAVRPDSSRPLRINCGAQDAYADRCPLGDITSADGAWWLYDQGHMDGTWGFTGDDGGRPSNRGNPSEEAVSDSDDAVLYRYWRNVRKTDKDQTWRFPVTDGDYTVVLHFADMRSDAAGERLLDAWLEGDQILDAFDAYAAAGPATVCSRSYPLRISDGEITLALRKNSAATADAFISAIEILPAGTSSMRSIACAVIDQNGVVDLDAVLDDDPSILPSVDPTTGMLVFDDLDAAIEHRVGFVLPDGNG